jgi:hypothetical protein
VRVLTRKRIFLAFAVAVLADALQIVLGPLGWVLPDEIIDVLVMVVTVWALGFHPLLLPTFIVELFPVVDMLPTWTACVAAVVFLRRREQPTVPPMIRTGDPAPVYTEGGERVPPPVKEPKQVNVV